MALTDSTEARNARAQAIADLCNAGSTNPNAKVVIADGGDNTLAELPMSDPAFSAPSTGTITANPISEAQASQSGTASVFKVVDKDEVEVYRGTIAQSGGDLTLPVTSISVGDYINIADGDFTRTEP